MHEESSSSSSSCRRADLEAPVDEVNLSELRVAISRHGNNSLHSSQGALAAAEVRRFHLRAVFTLCTNGELIIGESDLKIVFFDSWKIQVDMIIRICFKEVGRENWRKL